MKALSNFLQLVVASASIVYVENKKDVLHDGLNSTSISNESTTSDIKWSLNRPYIHYTPDEGWMNDPNGPWYDAKEKLFHLYYQYTPNATTWELPLYWGHAVSTDLTIWNEAGIAISPSNDTSGAYSGSVVIDYNNTSGFFNSSIDPRQRVVAIWTLNTAESETQYVSYSLDAGHTFQNYENNPVLSLNSTQFRDPKVIWHAESSSWIMTVASSHSFEILIYSSSNLRDWIYESSFSHEGFLGYQYECPGLAKVPYVFNSSFSSYEGSNVTSAFNSSFWNATYNATLINGTWPSTTLLNASRPYTNYTNSTIDISTEIIEKVGFAWVLFISINPGAPIGGSATQYFIGDFNGTHFNPFSHQTRFVDLGKDFYALQTFFNSPEENDVLGIAWASNWQYGSYVPTNPWRSSMSLVRNFTLTEFNPNPNANDLVLNSQPVLDFKALRKNESTVAIYDKNLKKGFPLSLNLSSPSGVFEFSMKWTTSTEKVNKTDFADVSLYLLGSHNRTEFLRLGYEANADAFFIDRGHSNIEFVEQNPFFTQRLSVNVQPNTNTTSTYEVYGLIDRNILELFFGNGTSTSTNLFFTTTGNYIGSMYLEAGVNDVYELNELKVNQFVVEE